MFTSELRFCKVNIIPGQLLMCRCKFWNPTIYLMNLPRRVKFESFLRNLTVCSGSVLTEQLVGITECGANILAGIKGFGYLAPKKVKWPLPASYMKARRIGIILNILMYV